MQKLYNLTQPQLRIWNMNKIHENSRMLNIGGIVNFKKEINIKLLIDSIENVIDNNDAFCINLIEVDNSVKQIFKENTHRKIEFYDLSSKKNIKNDSKDLENSFFNNAINITDEYLYKFLVYKNSDRSVNLLFLAHHVIVDGWSMNLIFDQILESYNSDNKKKVDKPSYKYYIEREKEYLISTKYVEDEQYWVNKFRDYPEDELYNTRASTEGKRIKFSLDVERKERIEKFCSNNSLSMLNFFIGVISICNSKLNQKNIFAIGMPFMNRTKKIEKRIVGMFVSTVPLKVIVNDNLEVIDFFNKIKSETIKSLIHEKYPYNNLINKLNLKKNDNLYKIAFNYYKFPFQDKKYKHTIDEIYPGFQFYSLQIGFAEFSPKDAFIFFDYKISEYNIEYIKTFYNCMICLIDTIIKNDQRRIKDIKLQSVEEELDLIKKYTGKTNNCYRENIIELFKNKVVDKPESTALVEKDKTITFSELDNRSNQFANYLRKLIVEPKQIVAICMKHSIEYFIAVLAVMKLNHCFLPIDPNSPKARIEYILNDAKCAILIIDSLENDKFNKTTLNISNINYLVEEKNITTKINGSDLAYCIYTSGSTGTPKGVKISHENLSNYITWASKFYLDDSDAFAFYSSIAFDLTITSTFAPLVGGNTIYIYNPNDSEFIIKEIFQERKSTIIKLTPAHLKLLLTYDLGNNLTVKKIIVGGENLPDNLCKEAYKKLGNCIEIYNEYGPTEATVGCMIYRYKFNEDNTDIVPIGLPIQNTNIYLLDNHGKIVPKGIPGEIYISGKGVANGFLNDKQLTEKFFLNDQYVENYKMYKTGDLAKYRNDDVIEYIGRKDNINKINGFRIDIKEIENEIKCYKQIDDVIVQIIKQKIVAFVLYKSGYCEKELKAQISKFLPYYMIPTQFIKIEKIPITINGKIDNKKLISIYYEWSKSINGESEEKFNFFNNDVINICKNVLEVDSIRENDNFFELGGDSIKAIQIVSKLQEKNIRLTVKDILSSNSFIDIIKYAKNTSDQDFNTNLDDLHNEFKVSKTIQWFFDQKYYNPNKYIHCFSFKLNGNHDIRSIEVALQNSLNNHDVLKVNYNSLNNVLKYTYNFKKMNDLISIYQAPTENEINEIINKHIQTFDIERTCLFKGLVFVSQDEYLIVFLAHHLVIDIYSWTIIIEDFMEALNVDKGENNKSKKKTLPYSKWSELQEKSYFSDPESSKVQIKNNTFINESEKLVKLPQFDKVNLKLHNDLKMTIEEFLVLVISVALKDSFSTNEFYWEIEKNGRIKQNNYNFSRTVGWFTEIEKSEFSLEGITEDNLFTNLNLIKEKFRSKQYHNQPQNIECSIIGLCRLNYIGDYGSVENNLKKIGIFDYKLELLTDDNNNRQVFWDIEALKKNEEIILKLKYPKNFISKILIDQISDEIKKVYNVFLLENDKNYDIGYSHTDFQYIDINPEELEIILKN